jgi:outer membrane protein OmpA-like peptidoglycan-associated protein
MKTIFRPFISGRTIFRPLGALLFFAYPLICQEANHQDVNRQDTNQGTVPIYRVTVIERSLKAINYQYRNGPTFIDFHGTVLLPKAKGEAIVESKQGRTQIDAKLENFTSPQTFGREYLTYVLWAITPDGRPHALGEVIPNSGNKASLRVTTDFQAFGLMITAEPYSAVHQPSDVVVAENAVREDTTGKIEEVNARYELLPRGHYTWQVSDALKAEVANAPKVSMHKYEALVELYQAQNALAIARNAHADQYAPNTFGKAQQLLTEAEQLNNNKSVDSHRVVESAREAAETAEDARLIAEQHEQQAKLDSANQQVAAAQQAQARAEAAVQQARADAAAAQARADAEGAARQRAEAEAAQARQRSLDAQAEAANRVQAAQAQAAAANANARSADRQQQVEAGKMDLRSRLFEQLNGALITRDTTRGLVVTVPDGGFNGASLKTAYSSQLIRISQIVATHPGLRVSVEGYTDIPETEAVASQRAQGVRDALAASGLPSSLLEAHGMGVEHPIGSNSTAAGRAENRRVEIVIAGDPIGRLPFWDRPYTLTLQR